MEIQHLDFIYASSIKNFQNVLKCLDERKILILPVLLLPEIWSQRVFDFQEIGILGNSCEVEKLLWKPMKYSNQKKNMQRDMKLSKEFERKF